MHTRTTAVLSTVILALTVSAEACLGQGAPKLLYIGIDGLRPDALLTAETPAIDSLIERGVLATDARCEDLTFSGPNWSTILHGVHRDKHAVTTNDYRGNSLEDYPDLFAWLEQHNPEWDTIRITTWDAIYKFQPTGADIDIFHEYSEDGDALAAADAAQLLAGTHPDYPETDVDAMFLYIADVDVAGHAHGFHPEQHDYLRAITVADALVGQVLEAMRGRPEILDENWLVILTTDHGGSMDKGHAGNTPEKRTIPFLVSGRDVLQVYPFPAPRNVDGVTTALAHMGVPVTEDMGLDGRVVGLDFPTFVETGLDVNLVFNGDAELDRGMPDQQIHQNIAGWNNPGPFGVTVVEYGSPDGYPGPDDPGPSQRGRNFFCGGASGVSTATQRIDLFAIADAIDSTEAVFTLAACLGGYADQRDYATVSVRWFDEDMHVLGITRLDPVMPDEREGATGLFRKEATGTPPSMARWAEVEIMCVRDAGSGNDGYVDDVSLVITMPEPDA